MANQPPGPIGREDELAALAADGPGGVLVVLHGERGSGRTVLLDELAGAGSSAGRPVLTVRGAGPRPEWDVYGVVPLLDAVTGGFEGLRATSELVGRTAALRRRCTPDSYRATSRRSALYAEIGRLLSSLGPSSLVLLDDIERVPQPEHVALAARAAGHRVVVAAGRPSVLDGAADTVVHAGPLGPDEVGRLVRRVLRARPDATLLAALRRALGPLAGNPATVLSAIDELRRSDRLVTVARRVCLRAPHVSPTLPDDALAMAAVGVPGGAAEGLVLLVDGPARVRAGEAPLLAAATGRTVQDTGRTLDRLVTDGVLEERHGELALRCPAVGATVRARSGTGRVRELHAAVVRAAADSVVSLLDPGVLADHVESAGDALEPGREWGTLLLAQAGEREGRAPRRAAELVRAAARHEHTPGDDEWTVRLLLRAGDHSGVLSLVTRLVEEGFDGDSELLAAAAAAAALSLGESVPQPVHEALTEDGDLSSALHLVRRWERGHALHTDELAAAMAPLVTTAPGPGRRSLGHRAAATALLSRDVVGALEALLGSSYRRPSRGSHLGFHRAAAALATGRWEEATNETRALFAEYAADESAAGARELTALLAVEAASWAGDERMAAVWRDYLPDFEQSRHRTLYAAVRATRLWVGGDGAAAIEHGYQVWCDSPGGAHGFGRRLLLNRLCVIAAVGGHREWHDRLRTAGDDWRRIAQGADTYGATEAWDFAEGLFGSRAEREARLARALEAARAHGHHAKVCWMLMAAGTAVADPTGPWAEAHAIASEIDSPVLRAQVRRLADEQGVRLPLGRTRDTGLSEVQARIVEMVEQGMTNRQIARDLQVSEKTVENHLTRLFVRFGCRTRYGLATARIATRRDEDDSRPGPLRGEDPLLARAASL